MKLLDLLAVLALAGCDAPPPRQPPPTSADLLADLDRIERQIERHRELVDLLRVRELRAHSRRRP